MVREHVQRPDKETARRKIEIDVTPEQIYRYRIRSDHTEEETPSGPALYVNQPVEKRKKRHSDRRSHREA